MNVRRIDNGSVPPPEHRQTNSGKQVRADRQDTFEPTGANRKAPESAGTYGRTDVARAAATPKAGHVEANMSTDARRLKIAAIEQRIQEGAYNERAVIEQVVDRILNQWGLRPSATPDDAQR